MTKNQIAYTRVREQLQDGMTEGNMHACLRDAGRLAGGFHAGGSLSSVEVSDLGHIAESMALNKRQAAEQWRQAVTYGQREPVAVTERHQSHDDGHALSWDDEIGIGRASGKIVDLNWLQSAEMPAPAADWQGGDTVRYLQALFDPKEITPYTVEAWQRDGDDKWLPSKGVYTLTAGEIIERIKRFPKELGCALGDWKPEAGAWTRINPFDGVGVKDENVTEYRHALIESDSVDLGRQLEIIRKLELPCAAIVHSGGKSIHAIVKVQAADMAEYRTRVDYLYEVCKKNGLAVDRQNRNPSRLSRLPGVDRNGKPQYLIATNTGRSGWADWQEWTEEQADNLPDMEPLLDSIFDPPALAPTLIDGVLRQGHKMLIAGPSKAGKSFDLIELCIAIAEGRKWHGWQCAKGRVLYVNLELDRPSAIHRFADVYKRLGIPMANAGNIDVWNLRGKSAPMDKLAPKLIRRAHKADYLAVLIDPIYKVLTGDENSAEEMAKFCCQFDRICHELGCATIYAHHHSKGAQGGKRSADRASGSGVFARDPDALIDLIELDISAERRKQIESALIMEVIRLNLGEIDGWEAETEGLHGDKLLTAAISLLPANQAAGFIAAVADVRTRAEHMSGWRIEGTLREFATFKARQCWFQWPIHVEDSWGLLKEAKAAGEEPPWMEQQRNKKESQKERNNDAAKSLEVAYDSLNDGEAPVTVGEIAQYIGIDDKTVRRRLKDHQRLTYTKGIVHEKGKGICLNEEPDDGSA